MRHRGFAIPYLVWFSALGGCELVDNPKSPADALDDSPHDLAIEKSNKLGTIAARYGGAQRLESMEEPIIASRSISPFSDDGLTLSLASSSTPSARSVLRTSERSAVDFPASRSMIHFLLTPTALARSACVI